MEGKMNGNFHMFQHMKVYQYPAIDDFPDHYVYLCIMMVMEHEKHTKIKNLHENLSEKNDSNQPRK